MNQWFQQDVFLQPFPLVTTSWMFSKMGPKQFTIFCVSISVAKQWLSSNMVFERSTKRCPFWWSASPTKLPSSKNWIFMGKTSYSDWWFGICFIFHFIYGMSSFQLTFTPWKILHQTMFGGYPKMGFFLGPKKKEPNEVSHPTRWRRPGDFPWKIGGSDIIDVAETIYLRCPETAKTEYKIISHVPSCGGMSCDCWVSLSFLLATYPCDIPSTSQ